LRRFFPARVDRYHEPFFGSGAVFFDLCTSGRLDPSRARISDDNADLVGTYLRVRDATAALLKALGDLAEGHEHEGRAHYYRVRDELFNPRRAQWVEQGGNPDLYPVDVAAMLLYLNRTGYNGLFRLNSSGEFNVPAGRYDAPKIVNEDRLRAAAAVLTHAALSRARFDAALTQARTGDLVYLDPPYAPLSRTSSFRAYTATGFDHAEQRLLRDEVVRLAAKGVHVVLSNSTAPEVVALYETEAARDAGLRCYRVAARRAINTRADRRGTVMELVVANTLA
jgi:DNA adenine methylase